MHAATFVTARPGSKENLMSDAISRRAALTTFGGVGVAALLAACGSDSNGSSASSGASTLGATGASTGSTSSGDSAAAGSSRSDCEAVPVETAGPFPGDGSNGPDVLSQDGVVRRDITSSFAGMSGTADGVPLEVEFRLVAADGCTPLPGAAMYAWHCDATGGYSLYSDGLADQNYLRGVQVADDDGVVRFTSVFPGCYPGRWPHMHFEVYSDVASATGGGAVVATSQLAFPADASESVYADNRYGNSAASLSQLSLESDNVFADDGGVLQLATMSGDPASGYTARLDVAV
jgi:protocatechuate 3,4-dioxygenase beta subunit